MNPPLCATAELLILPDAAHLLNVEHPDTVDRALNTHLGGITSMSR
jgi:pimeloyl-ACP methyl ester carboxylesterase